jgi:hypothetical protein
VESGLREVPVHNSNYVLVKRDVEYFNKIPLQNKRKGVENDFLGSHNIQLRYRIGERLQSLENMIQMRITWSSYNMENDNIFIHELSRNRTSSIV